MQCAPLLEECELDHAGHVQLPRQSAARALQRLGLAARQLARPAVPVLGAVKLAKDVEEYEIIQPDGAFLAEAAQAFMLLGARLSKEVPGSFAQQRQLGRPRLVIIDGGNAVRQRLQALALDPSAIGQPLQADQQRVSRKGRGGGVGRIPHTQGTERQYLPEALPGSRKELYEVVGGGAEVADAATRRQRGGMQQDAGSALERHR